MSSIALQNWISVVTDGKIKLMPTIDFGGLGFFGGWAMGRGLG